MLFPPQGLVAAALQPYSLVSLLLTPNVTANDQIINAAPTASTVTAANAKSFTGTIGQIVLPAITPAANGSGITLTGLNFTQGAIANVADSEAITVKHIVMTFAAGAALETGVLTQTAIDITLANQAANGAANAAKGIKIAGGTQSASGTQIGIDITMAAAAHAAININEGAFKISGVTPAETLTWTNTANYGQILFYENTTPAGAVQAIGSTFTTAGRRKNLEIVNSLDGGRIAFRVSPGAVGQEVGSIYTNSLHIGSDTGYFTAYGLPFSGGAFSVGIGFGATVTVTDDTYKEALHVALIGQKTSAAWAAGALEGLEGEVRVGAANTQNWTLPLGLIGAFGHPLIETGSSGTITGVVGLLSSGGWIGAGAAVTNWYGAYLANPVPSGTLLANNYGLYIEAMTAGNSLNYAIYSAGGLNHFVGNVNTVDVYSVDGTQVVGARQVDARINDVPNSGDVTTDGIIAALQACVQTHGLMTAS